MCNQCNINVHSMIKISYIDRSQNDIYHRYNDNQHDQSSKISYFSIVEGVRPCPPLGHVCPLKNTLKNKLIIFML